VSELLKKWWMTDSVCDRKGSERNVPNEEKDQDIQVQLDISP
jgi:hypothetical protein